MGSLEEHAETFAHPWFAERTDLKRAREAQLAPAATHHRRDRDERLVQHHARRRARRRVGLWVVELQVVAARALHRDLHARKATERIAPYARRQHRRVAGDRLARLEHHAGHLARRHLAKRLDLRVEAERDAVPWERTEKARDQVVRRAVGAVLHVDRARDLALEARVAAAELVALDPLPLVAEPLEAPRLRLGVRHVLRLHHHVEPAVARVVAIDRLGGEHSLEDLKRLPAHRAQHVHAAVEVPLAMEMEVPEPRHQLPVEARLDVRGAVRENIHLRPRIDTPGRVSG
jgi:hypothetical protein